MCRTGGRRSGQRATGCPAQNFIVSATHTHSSHTQGLGQGAPTAKSVADAIVEAASVAKSKPASARIGYGKTTVDLNVNRVLGDINFVTVNGEVYSEIGMRLKAEAPANRTLMVTLANGSANAGYIYADKAYSHLTFQVIGSRLKPGCAEGKIVATAIRLMRVAGQ